MDLEVRLADDLRWIRKLQVPGEGRVAADEHGIAILPEDTLREGIQDRPQHDLRPEQLVLDASPSCEVAKRYRAAVTEPADPDLDARGKVAGSAPLETGLFWQRLLGPRRTCLDGLDADAEEPVRPGWEHLEHPPADQFIERAID